MRRIVYDDCGFQELFIEDFIFYICIFYELVGEVVGPQCMDVSLCPRIQRPQTSAKKTLIGMIYKQAA